MFVKLADMVIFPTSIIQGGRKFISILLESKLKQFSQLNLYLVYKHLVRMLYDTYVVTCFSHF